MKAWDSMHLVTLAQNLALARRGFALAIPGATHPSLNQSFQINLAAALGARMMVGTYAVPRSEHGRLWVERAWEHAGPFRDKLLFIALDCETPAAADRDRIHQALEALAAHHYPQLIYTAYWWWVGRFGNPTEFAHTWLWNALYDYDEDFDFPSLPYGGWGLGNVAMEQYRGTYKQDGAVIDANIVAPQFVSVITKEEGDMPELVREEGSPFVFIIQGALCMYLDRWERADALGITRSVRRVPNGFLRNYWRLDNLRELAYRAVNENKAQQAWLELHQRNAGVHGS